MAWINDLKALAMQSVLKEDLDYLLRDVFRWYSKEYATPLHVVETLPLEDVLRHYYEVKYAELSEPERLEEIDRLLLTEEALRIRKVQEDADDADAYEYAKAAEKAEAKKAAAPKPAPTKASAPATLPKIKDLKELPPEVEINFIDDNEDPDALLEGAFGPPSKKK